MNTEQRQSPHEIAEKLTPTQRRLLRGIYRHINVRHDGYTFYIGGDRRIAQVNSGKSLARKGLIDTVRSSEYFLTKLGEQVGEIIEGEE